MILLSTEKKKGDLIVIHIPWWVKEANSSLSFVVQHPVVIPVAIDAGIQLLPLNKAAG